MQISPKHSTLYCTGVTTKILLGAVFLWSGVWCYSHFLSSELSHQCWLLVIRAK